MKKKRVNQFLAILLLTLVFLPIQKTGIISTTEGASIEELKKEISERNQRIIELESEINQYEKQVANTAKEAKTFANAVNRLNAERKKLLSEISVTENKISATNLTIEGLSLNIDSTEKKIQENKDTISKAFQSMQLEESQSFLEQVLIGETVAETLDKIDSLSRIQENVRNKIAILTDLKEDLENKHQETQKKKDELVVLKEKIVDQKEITESNKADQARLLAIKKNQEAEYAKELERVKNLKEAFERELLDLESKLRFEIDPTKIPEVGRKILNYPLPNTATLSCWKGGESFKNCLTQFFGTTSFSKTGVYNGQGHNGIDFRASRGTEIYASLSGVVEGIGNTDAQKGCYSYGKWILIRHNNGLSTLYAHLDLIKVSAGQSITTGDLIGYTGATGNVTGPHLHFTVFATQGVKIVRIGDIKEKTHCSNVSIPVADLRAYLDPLSYL